MIYEKKSELARAVVVEVVREKKVLQVDETEVPEDWQQKGACFVTLYVKGKLHGCIGSIEAVQPLYKDIVENAVGSATRDYRFPPLTSDELNDLTVEVSILTPLKSYVPSSNESLLKYLEQVKPGLVINKNGQRAVFLPQVWEQLPKAEQFLQQLCLKAGLSAVAWREGMLFEIFEVIEDE